METRTEDKVVGTHLEEGGWTTQPHFPQSSLGTEHLVRFFD